MGQDEPLFIDIEEAKRGAYKKFPFTESAIRDIEKARFGLLQKAKDSPLKEGVEQAGEGRMQGVDARRFITNLFSPISGKAANFALNTTKGIQRMDRANINIGTSSPRVVGHEMLHQVFDNSALSRNPLSRNNKQNSIFFINKFINTWDTVSKKDKVLGAIDKNIEKNYEAKKLSPSLLATERFAYLGELVGKHGVAIIPRELRPYYHSVFK